MVDGAQRQLPAPLAARERGELTPRLERLIAAGPVA